MKHMVITPFATFSLFVLLLLMVQLAGLNRPTTPASPTQELSGASVLSDMTFSEPASQASIEPELLEANDFTQAVVAEPMMELAPIEVDSPLADILQSMTTNELAQPAELAELDISLDLASDNNVLQGIAIASPARKKPVKQKQLKPQKVNKKAESRPQKNKAPANKTENSQMQANKAASNSAQRSSAGTTKASATPIYRVKPQYPKRAQRRGIEGQVVVSFIVNKKGTVNRDSIRIVRANPSKVFNKSVFSALLKWRFKPPVSAYRTQYTLDFSLKSNRR